VTFVLSGKFSWVVKFRTGSGSDLESLGTKTFSNSKSTISEPARSFQVSPRHGGHKVH